MRFIHLADLHIGSVLQSGDASLAMQTKEAVWQHLEQLFANLDKEGIDLLLLAGDIFEPSSLQKADLERFIACLALVKRCYILAVAGNHDPLTTSSPWQTVLHAKLANFHLFASEVESIYFPSLKTIVSGYSFASLYQTEAVLPELKNSARLYEFASVHTDGTTKKELIAMAMPNDEEKAAYLSANFCISLVHASLEHPAFPLRQDDYHYNPLTVDMLTNSKVDYLALGHFHKPIISRYCPDFFNWQPVMPDVLYTAEYVWNSKDRLIAKQAQTSKIANKAKTDCLLTYAGTLAAWPGNLLGRNFGESAYRGYFIGEWQQGHANTQTVQNKLVFKEEQALVKQLAKESLADTTTQPDAANFILKWQTNKLRQYWQVTYDIANLRNKLKDACIKTDTLASFFLAKLSNQPAAKLNFYRLHLVGTLEAGEEVDALALQAKLQLAYPQLEVEMNLEAALDWPTLRQNDRLADLLLKTAEQDKDFKQASSAAKKASLQIAWQALQND